MKPTTRMTPTDKAYELYPPNGVWADCNEYNRNAFLKGVEYAQQSAKEEEKERLRNAFEAGRGYGWFQAEGDPFKEEWPPNFDLWYEQQQKGGAE